MQPYALPYLGSPRLFLLSYHNHYYYTKKVFVELMNAWDHKISNN